MGFQTRVNLQPAPAVAGDFAGTNPRMSVTAPPNGYTVAPDYPLTFGGALTEALLVGRFAWFNYATGLASNYFQPNSILGFVHREDQTVITKFLVESRVGVQQGFPVTGIVQGDVWADLAPGPDAAGLVIYADPVTGKASAAAAGQGVTFTFTASVAGNALTVTATTGTLAAGQAIQNAALGLVPGTFITAQISGSAGAAGVYQLNQSNPVIGSGTITAYGKQQTRWKLAQPVAGQTSFTGQFVGTQAGSPPAGPFLPDGLLTVTGGITNGPISQGMLLAGANGDIPGFAIITGQKSGTIGGDGVYTLNYSPTPQGATETMTGSQGTLGKISTWQA